MRLISLDIVGSTNAVAREYANAGDLGPLWIKADQQTEGRGRRGRAWKSVKGNLYSTGLYPSTGDVRHTALLSFVAALAVYDLIETYSPNADIALKWPNDVLINGAKVSGILLESGSYKAKPWVAVGIGINLVSHPEGTEFPATHLLEHLDPEDLNGPEPIFTGVDAALAILASRFEHWQSVFHREGFGSIRQAWLERAYNLPGRVRVRLPKEEFEGDAIELGENGELQVRLGDGTIRNVHAGDVFFADQGKPDYASCN